jgi:lipoyl(octanoyl) transferase
VNSSALDVFFLGCVDFDAFLLLQDRLTAEVQSRSDRYGMLVVCQHPPLISLGRDGTAADLCFDLDDLELQRLPIRWVGRGGGAWRHGPGQLSVSVMVPLERMEFSPVRFRQAMLRGILKTAREMRVPARNSEGTPGASGRIGQFAFLGAAVRAGVSQFGCVVNVAPDHAVTAFSPAGVRGSSLAAERFRPIAMAAVRESLTRQLAAELGYQVFHVHTGHPWLRRTTMTVPIHA